MLACSWLMAKGSTRLMASCWSMDETEETEQMDEEREREVQGETQATAAEGEKTVDCMMTGWLAGWRLWR